MNVKTVETQIPSNINNFELSRLPFSPSILMLIGLLTLYGVLAILQDRGSGDKLASGRFAGAKERRHAQEKAIEQMVMRKHNAVAFYIGTPTSRDDRRPLYFPDAQRSSIILGGPGSGKTFSFIDPALRSALEQGFPTMLYDFKYPSQAKIASYAMSLGYEVQIFAPG